MTARGSNPHLGRTCFMVMRPEDVRRLRAVVAGTRRCVVDVVRLALRHFEYRPHRYAGMTGPRLREQRRVYLRLSRNLTLSIADVAWSAGWLFSRWLGAVTARFLQLADRRKLSAALRRGADLQHHLEL